jgi:tetratricopeptide (TPR) repeat protein
MSCTSPESYCIRGTARYTEADLAGALADLDQALELNPDYPEAYNNRGATRQARGDLPGALADFNRA